MRLIPNFSCYMNIGQLIICSTILFRPLFGEEHVDIAIVTQVIAPILEGRIKDG